ncbi:DUF4221 family protein [Lunatibacter salilacus]|uniref:DUF4221 family protein n=1 Tax=Lunatibacter salilacus TaxID=2483804 RepID=UPI00131AC516|nr:DUF4221 family protein [Lunatibacter salilacus]
MKTYALVFCSLFIFACSENKSHGDSRFLLTQDTVVVDPKGSIIDLRYGLNYPELSNDGKTLYHYTFGEAKFDKINLDNLQLEETLQFEKEGPNGMGRQIRGYGLTSSDQIMIWSHGINALFDQSGKKIRDLNLNKIAPEFDASRAIPIRLIEHPDDPNTIFGLYATLTDYRYVLVKYDLDKESHEKIPLPETEKLKEYRMEVFHGEIPAGVFSPSPSLTQFQDKILLTNDAYNEVYVYDIPLDSLYLISWNSELTENQNQYKLPKTTTPDQAAGEIGKYKESINFMAPKWDPDTQRFIRLSYKTLYGEDQTERGEPIATGADVFLTVLDKDLNIVKETFLDRYNKTPPPHFFKDNKIWLYENIDDEMGFVRITVD